MYREVFYHFCNGKPIKRVVEPVESVLEFVNYENKFIIATDEEEGTNIVMKDQAILLEADGIIEVSDELVLAHNGFNIMILNTETGNIKESTEQSRVRIESFGINKTTGELITYSSTERITWDLISLKIVEREGLSLRGWQGVHKDTPKTS